MATTTLLQRHAGEGETIAEAIRDCLDSVSYTHLTSYASEDTDLLGVDEDYTALENELAPVSYTHLARTIALKISHTPFFFCHMARYSGSLSY